MRQMLRKEGSHEYSLNLAGITSFLSTALGHEWIIETGSTHHITPFKEILISLKVLQDDCKVQVLKGGKSKISNEGDSLVMGDRAIHNVLHVSDFKLNLLSLSKLIRELSCVVTFLPYVCIF